MKILSDCCSAPLFPVETDICSKCYQVCEPVTTGVDRNGNEVKIKI